MQSVERDTPPYPSNVGASGGVAPSVALAQSGTRGVDAARSRRGFLDASRGVWEGAASGIAKLPTPLD